MKRRRIGCVEGYMERDGAKGERVANIHYWSDHDVSDGIHAEMGYATKVRYTHGNETFPLLDGRRFTYFWTTLRNNAAFHLIETKYLPAIRAQMRAWVRDGVRPDEEESV